MQTKNTLVKIGDFFFKTRNYIFPVILVALFLSFPPPADYFGFHWLEDAKDVVSALLVFAGLGLRSATIGWVYIKRGGLNKQVYADTLVTSGYFGMSRNPLYVGNMLIYSGIFMFHGHPAVIVMGIALYWFIYEAIIAAEEYFLREKFGKEYEAYCKSVPRWLPDCSKYKQAINGMSFSYLRAISKDYTTIFNAILAICAIEIIEHYFYSPADMFINVCVITGFIMSACLIGVALIKYLKAKNCFRQAL